MYCHRRSREALKYLHRKRGKEAWMGISSVLHRTLIHDVGRHTVVDKCTLRYAGRISLRDLTFIVESNNYRWARLMKKLRREFAMPSTRARPVS